jgi:hypothetical protein
MNKANFGPLLERQGFGWNLERHSSLCLGMKLERAEAAGDCANSYLEYGRVIRQTNPGEPAKCAGQSMQPRARELYLAGTWPGISGENRRIP